MKKIFLIVFASLSIPMVTNGQNTGPSYRQFFFNPYLFNPAFAGINDRTEVSFVYRQQWINFKDAPVMTALSLQYPASRRVSLGLNISSDKQVLLKNSSFMATFGYVVPFSDSESLRFGLSAGTGINALDLTAEELNTSDPALLNAASNSYYLDGNFGVVYTRDRLRASFALTKLFKSNPFNPQSFNEVALSNLRNQLYSLSYRFPVGPMETITLEPYVLYRVSDYGLTSEGTKRTLEVASLAYFKDTFWTGVSYNQHNGMALFLGMDLKDKFRFSYSFEFPPFSSELPSTSSHELHFSLKLGKKNFKPGGKRRAHNSNTGSETFNESHLMRPVYGSYGEPSNDDDAVTETNQLSLESSQEPEASSDQENNAIDIQAQETMTSLQSPTLTTGNYIVIGVFRNIDSSLKFIEEIKSKGHTAKVGLNTSNNFYYVYLHSAKDMEEAKKARNQYKLNSLFQKAWILTME